MRQKHKRFSKKLQYLSIFIVCLNLHNCSIFLVYAVKQRALIFKQLVYHFISELRCERAFSESYIAVSFVDVTKFASDSLEF